MKGAINGEDEGDPRVQQKHPGPTQPDAGDISAFQRQYSSQITQRLSFHFLYLSCT